MRLAGPVAVRALAFSNLSSMRNWTEVHNLVYRTNVGGVENAANADRCYH